MIPTALVGFIYGLGSAVFKSASEIFSKYGLTEDINEYVMGWSLRFFAIPFVGLVLIQRIYKNGIPEIDPIFWPALMFSGISSVIATVLYVKALKYSDISIISPLSAISPLLLLITSPIIVNEFPDPIGLSGVVIVTLGLYIMRLDSKETGYLEPFKSIYRDKGSRYILLQVFIYSLTSNVDKVATEASAPVFYSFSLHIVSATGMFILMIYFAPDWKSKVQNNWKSIVPVGAFSGVSSIVQMIAFTYTLVIYVITLKRVGTLISVMSGAVIFDEESIKERIAGAAVILVGLSIISISLA